MLIGLLGGSFNPPHAAHRLISETAIKRLSLSQVWWMVTPGNPLKGRGDLAPLAERIWLSRRVSNHPRIKVTAFEAGLGTPFTAASLERLRSRHPDGRFVWLMGADNLESFHLWKDWRSIFELMPILVEDRPGWRYRALASRAASVFGRYKIAETSAGVLPYLTPPAWCYLSGPVSTLSSTALRSGLITPRS
jgi:nicotinate-nucleotide adenylyltransferase